MRLIPKTVAGRVVTGVLAAGVIAVPLGLLYCVVMPGSSFTGELAELSQQGVERRDRMREHVRVLAEEIVSRDVVHPESLEASADYLRGVWTEQGYAVADQEYRVGEVTVRNLEVEIGGSELPHEIVIVGAHYDSAYGRPGADDNASGVAALLELSRAFAPASASVRPRRTVRFVAFTNEEPPHFQRDSMGSLIYAQRSFERRENIVGMLSLETIAYFSNEPGSQQYPWPLGYFYGDRGHFIAFVGDIGSRAFVHEAIASFRSMARIPSDGIAAPLAIPGIGWSDHWSFSQQGYPALMVTDTAPFRNPNYHTVNDTLETLDLDRMTRVVDGLEFVLRELIGG